MSFVKAGDYEGAAKKQAEKAKKAQKGIQTTLFRVARKLKRGPVIVAGPRMRKSKSNAASAATVLGLAPRAGGLTVSLRFFINAFRCGRWPHIQGLPTGQTQLAQGGHVGFKNSIGIGKRFDSAVYAGFSNQMQGGIR